MKARLLYTGIVTGIILSALGFSSGAQAALISCPLSFTTDGTAKVHDGTLGKNTAASACQYDDATGNSDVANLTNINASVFFGFSDWSDNGQTQIDPPNDATGLWSILSVDFALFDYLMVFKDGEGTHLTAFLFNEEFSSGGWDTPFTDPPFDLPGNSKVHEVSHYSIFARENSRDPGTTPVPEPATLLLFGFGLAGLAVARRRGRKAKA